VSSALEPWREPVRGGHPDGQEFALTGADQLRALLTGVTPMPPLTRLFGTKLVDAGPGHATFELPLSGWLRAADGRIPAGPLVMPVDAAMACAIMTGLPAHTGLTTSELTLRQLRPTPPRGRLRAQARVIHPDGPLALAEAALRDEADALVAHAISTCFLMPGQPVVSDWAATADAVTEPGTPDPWQREPPDWQPANPDAGHSAPPPLGRLTGLRLLRAHDGAATCVLPATRWRCAPPPGRVQGGAVAMLAEAAMSHAVRGPMHGAPSPGSAFAPVALHVNYLRPLAADGREARADARVVNIGRRFMLASAEVRDADDRLIATASSSSIAADLLGAG
jgi:uncharacterized protein (TIGR00369 family)